MLSSVLNSRKAIEVNINIMRVYTRIRELFLAHKDVFIRVEQVEKQMIKQDQKIELLFTYLNKFMDKVDGPKEQIGFKAVFEVDLELLNRMYWFEEVALANSMQDFFAAKPVEYKRIKFTEQQIFGDD